MRQALYLALFFAIPVAALWQTTYYVPDDFATIQEAVEAVINGDTIVARPGTYHENIDFVGKAITLRSDKGPDCTTIDGNQVASVVSFLAGEGPDSVIEGFRLTNGRGSGGPNASDGGGVACMNSHPTIANNIISNNSANEFGGGISCFESSPKIIGNVIAGNVSNSDSGGIDCWESDPAIVNNIISGNSAALSGGAISCFTSSPDIFQNTITENRATGFGGGIQCRYDSSPRMANTILWNNNAAFGREIALIVWFSVGSELTVSDSDVMDGQAACFVDPGCTLHWLTGMIDADPDFVDAAGEDFHLAWKSPCRDMGDNSFSLSSTDIDGDPRITLGTVDLGADEYHYHLYHMGDVVGGSTIDLKIVGFPGTNITLYLGSGLADPPYSTQYGTFYLNWPPQWQGFFGPVPGNGVLRLPATVPWGWPSGSEHPLQALVGPWGGPWTRLTNAEVLVVE